MAARRLLALVVLSATTAAPIAAGAVTLDDAIALAQAHDPGLRRARAEGDAAHARVQQARAGRLPTVAAQASAAEGSTDFDQFFGFGQYTLKPRMAELSIQQPLFSGGAVSASIAQAKAGAAEAQSMVESTRLGLIADVAEAYVGVQVAEKALSLRLAQVGELDLVLAQSRRRFDDGESARTDVDQAQARLSAAKAGVAAAQGDLAKARARYRTLVGEEPADLQAATVPPAPASLDEALAGAQANNPGVAAAEAAERAAEAGVRRAKADRLPTVGLVAQASTIRDQFLPGYRADGATIGIQGRWVLFDSGATSGKVSEAEAGRRAAEAALDQARALAEEAAIDAWQTRQTADAVANASADEARAADAALYDVREEVRVGAKPTLDLLDAEREALAARIRDLGAQGARVVAAYRLEAVIGFAGFP